MSEYEGKLYTQAEVRELRADLDGMTAACTKTQDMLDGVRAELDEARAEIARLRATNEQLITFCESYATEENWRRGVEVLRETIGAMNKAADGGQKTSEPREARVTAQPPIRGPEAGQRDPPPQTRAPVAGASEVATLSAIPPRAASGGFAEPTPSPDTPTPCDLGISGCTEDHAAKRAASGSERWRVGHKVPRNLYRGDEPIAMLRDAELASEIAEAMNSWEQMLNGRELLAASGGEAKAPERVTLRIAFGVDSIPGMHNATTIREWSEQGDRLREGVLRHDYVRADFHASAIARAETAEARDARNDPTIVRLTTDRDDLLAALRALVNLHPTDLRHGPTTALREAHELLRRFDAGRDARSR